MLPSHLFYVLPISLYHHDKGKPRVSVGRKVMGPPDADRQTAERLK
jgi:hypothetical protein